MDDEPPPPDMKHILPPASIAFHADGRTARDSTGDGLREMWSRYRVLCRRIDAGCQPVSLIGRVRILLVRRRWIHRLRKRFSRPHALFLNSPSIFRIRTCSRNHCRF